MEETPLKILGEFTYHRNQKELYKSGVLWKQWYEQYPILFDEKNAQWSQNQWKYGYQFVESLAKLKLYTATGYLPLTGNEYRYNPQLRKLFISL